MRCYQIQIGQQLLIVCLEIMQNKKEHFFYNLYVV